MNELTMFSDLESENSSGLSEKTVTTRELAEVLDVDVTTVRKAVKRLEQGGEVLHYLTKDKYGNDCFIYTEEQATLIKQEIQKHHNLASRQIDNITIDFNSALTQRWYTIEELASLCGFKDAHSMQSNPNILELLKQFRNSNDVKKGGYHNLRCFYSEKVLKALKQYQLRNSAPNALSNKITAIEGNVMLVTGKGLTYLARKFNTEIDHSVKADM